MRRLAAAAALLLGLGLAGPAKALVCGTLLPLTVTATAVSFGDYTATDPAPVEAGGTVSLSCLLPLDVLPDFAISLSKGGSGTYAARTMNDGARTLDYNLYTGADYATVWGDGTGGTLSQTYNETLQLGAIALAVHGRVPAGQWTGAGVYQDTIVVTVVF